MKDYTGPLNADNIVAWVRKEIGDTSTLVWTSEQLNALTAV